MCFQSYYLFSKVTFEEAFFVRMTVIRWKVRTAQLSVADLT